MRGGLTPWPVFCGRVAGAAMDFAGAEHLGYVDDVRVKFGAAFEAGVRAFGHARLAPHPILAFPDFFAVLGNLNRLNGSFPADVILGDLFSALAAFVHRDHRIIKDLLQYIIIYFSCHPGLSLTGFPLSRLRARLRRARHGNDRVIHLEHFSITIGERLSSRANR